jgi:hypothetical protein
MRFAENFGDWLQKLSRKAPISALFTIEKRTLLPKDPVQCVRLHEIFRSDADCCAFLRCGSLLHQTSSIIPRKKQGGNLFFRFFLRIQNSIIL